MASLASQLSRQASATFSRQTSSLKRSESTNTGGGGSGGSRLSKEEELLLQDFSRNVSVKSSALFYGNGLVVSALPLWLFWRVHHLELLSTLALLFVPILLASAYLVAMAYKNRKFVLKHKIAQHREAAVANEINSQLADDKRVSKKERDERILWRKNEVADFEATTYSIFYNNVVFLLVVIVLSSLIFRSQAPYVNYIISMLMASGLTALLST